MVLGSTAAVVLGSTAAVVVGTWKHCSCGAGKQCVLGSTAAVVVGTWKHCSCGAGKQCSQLLTLSLKYTYFVCAKTKQQEQQSRSSVDLSFFFGLKF